MTARTVVTEASAAAGLTSEEAAARFAVDGPNLLPHDERRTVPRILFGIAREPMVLLLLLAATLYLSLGDRGEALTLLASVGLVVVITLVQEGRTEAALRTLRSLSSPRAQVLRDGKICTLPARDLVRGDVIRVAEGDRVPADAVVRSGTVLAVDESILTGESVPVSKVPDPGPTALVRPGGDGNSSLFSGTLVVSGRSLAEVVATGRRSEFGKIGVSLAALGSPRTPLQREVDLLVRRTAIAAILLSGILVLARGFTGGDWVAAALSGLTLAMALLPEEFPVVFTVFLALGAWRIAGRRVLTRKIAGVEALGAVEVLCTDKTGTLTENRMTIRNLRTGTDDFDIDETRTDLPESLHELVEFGILACPPDPFDPMERAFQDLGRRTLDRTEHLHPQWRTVHEYPLTPELLAVTHVWHSPEREDLVAATKGAPEAIFDLCHLSPAELDAWRERALVMARAGLRVLGVARSQVGLSWSPERAHDIPFHIAGLVGLLDPLRPSVPEAVRLCKTAGIRVILITGDHPETARAIAASAGIDAMNVATGPELEVLDDTALAARLEATTVVARAVPAHKLRLVQALRAREFVTAMTGDGVNDAPALKAADIGIAMGARGTDVAREAASLVLINDDFGSIVEAVRTGRRIYDNLGKAFAYIVAVHVPIAGLALVPALLGWPAMLAPAHVVFLELIIDPTSSVVLEMEPEEPGLMDRAPRPHAARLLDRSKLASSFLKGAFVLSAVLAVLHFAREEGLSGGAQRTLSFVSLVVGNLAILVTSRSTTEPFWTSMRRRNTSVPILLFGVLTALALLVAVAPLRELFGFEPCGLGELLFAAAVSAAAALALDSAKAFRGVKEFHSPAA